LRQRKRRENKVIHERIIWLKITNIILIISHNWIEPIKEVDKSRCH